MTAYRPSRNLVERHADGKLVNVARFRGNLFVCAQACCCGRTEMKNSPVPVELYDAEWTRRRLRNYVHLTIGGCLGPCALANVAMLVFDGQVTWFQSLNDEASVLSLFDYIEGILDAGGHTPPTGALGAHTFTASRWQPRPDGQPVDDHRDWSGRERRPDPIPLCELSEADIAAISDIGTPAAAGVPIAVPAAIAAMDGTAALPRKNGELVFEEPWHGRAFGIAVALHGQGAFEWEAFRQRLIGRIDEAESRPEPFEYYRCWLQALEDVLVLTGMVAETEADERALEFEFGERAEVF
jgi:nitrile hydratase accessory protein